MPRGEVGAFHVARALPQKLGHFPLISVNALRLHPDHPSLTALLDHLKVLPARLGLLPARRPSPPSILRHFSPYLHHRLVISTPSIGDQWRWRMPMSSLILELIECFDGGLRLALGYPTRRPQSGVALDQRAAPELSPARALLIAPFCPLLPT